MSGYAPIYALSSFDYGAEYILFHIFPPFRLFYYISIDVLLKEKR